MEKTWTSPEAATIQFDKVFVLAISNQEDDRLFAETAIARQIRNIAVVRSFEVLEIDELKDRDRVVNAIEQSGADGLVVTRLVDVQGRITRGRITTSPMDYQVFSDFYETVYSVTDFYASDPRAINIDNVISVEVSIYDMDSEKLIWTGQTKTTKSFEKTQNVDGLITEIGGVVRSTLKSQGLIP